MQKHTIENQTHLVLVQGVGVHDGRAGAVLLVKVGQDGYVHGGIPGLRRHTHNTRGLHRPRPGEIPPTARPHYSGSNALQGPGRVVGGVLHSQPGGTGFHPPSAAVWLQAAVSNQTPGFQNQACSPLEDLAERSSEEPPSPRGDSVERY